jgi:hypothetical protein
MLRRGFAGACGTRALGATTRRLLPKRDLGGHTPGNRQPSVRILTRLNGAAVRETLQIRYKSRRRLDRTQEVAGSSRASSIEGLQMGRNVSDDRRQKFPVGRCSECPSSNIRALPTGGAHNDSPSVPAASRVFASSPLTPRAKPEEVRQRCAVPRSLGARPLGSMSTGRDSALFEKERRAHRGARSRRMLLSRGSERREGGVGDQHLRLDG